MNADHRPIAVYHEHPDWFRPLFAELDRRGLPYVRIDPRSHFYDPADNERHYSLFINRMSPSAYLRGGVQATFYTLGLLAHLERIGVPIVNGLNAFTTEISKARQITIFESLGLPYPRARVINHAERAVDAAAGLRFPVVVKANVGGSGAGIVRFDRLEDLASAAAANRLNLGIDHTALVQEFIPARAGHITRVETLGGKYLYGIKVFTPGDTFNLCPADACQRSDGIELTRTACPIDAPRSGIKVEGYTPPRAVIEAIEAIVRIAGIDLGGIEYMVDDRDGKLLYYDVNALSNFVADARNVVGLDPFARLVDYLEVRAGFRAEAA
jgi:hypothetical protein